MLIDLLLRPGKRFDAGRESNSKLHPTHGLGSRGRPVEVQDPSKSMRCGILRAAVSSWTACLLFSLEWPIELNGSVLNWTAAYVDWPKLRVNARRHGSASCWMINVDAEHVKNYAAIHVGTDRKDPPDAGDDAAPASSSSRQ